MKLNDMIKKSFGEKFKIARENAGYSRFKLSQAIKVSAKTIQSWEDGRTYIENMGLIPIIEKRLGFFVPSVLGDTVREEVDKIKRIKKKLKAQKKENKIEKEEIAKEIDTINPKQENKENLEEGEKIKEIEENVKKESQELESKEEEMPKKNKNVETSNVSSFLK